MTYHYSRSLRDGDLIGLFIGVANLVIVCWGTFVLFGYGNFKKWDLDKENPIYCDHSPVVVALANLIASWVIVPLFTAVEFYKLCKACSLRLIKSDDGHQQKKRIQGGTTFHNASLKINGIV
ncbi:Uncharacterized protein FKW44_001640 [Caligus rogercresseyi]|uniref:Uncharacterized protein n=1 Tax=Caligus rogercresseyi TaxID=217165 RepID=A0A7T8QVQ0_CALRO|nr:Uncharacterized protein FKW44_001640 [Caligus rogercresseyi]